VTPKTAQADRESPAAPAIARAPGWLRIVAPGVLIVVWFAFFAAGGAAFGGIGDVSENDQSQLLPASAEATRVQQLQAEFVGDDVIPAVVVFESRRGALDDAQRDAIAHASEALRDVDGVAGDEISPPLPSDDGEAAEIVVPLASDGEIGDVVSELRQALADNPVDGVDSHVAGPAGLTADLVAAFGGIDSLLLLVALGAVFVILVIVYRSPLLPVIVLFSSMSALTAAVFTVVQLARADIIVLTGQTQGILFILVIGAATDYSLLYIARYREALRMHRGKWEATWSAVRASWEPILASGGTVIAGLLILMLSDLNSNKALGPVAALGILFAVAASLTLLPSLLLWCGRAAFWPLRPTATADGHRAHAAGRPGYWQRTAALVARRPRLIWAAVTVLLAVMSLGMLQLKADGVPQSEFVLGESPAREGQAAIARHFAAGAGTPVVLIAGEDELADVAAIVLGTDGVDSLSVMADDSPSGMLPVTEDGIQAAGPPGTPAPDPTVVDGRIMLRATLDVAGDSTEALAIVGEMREDLTDRAGAAAVSERVLVGGTSAVALDSNTAAIHDRNLIIPLVLVVITGILMLLLRAILAPLLLIATVVLSFTAALGVSALVFNGLFGFPGADPSVPLFGFVFLVALGIDYNIFLMTRVREESVAQGTRTGILRGLAVTGGVISSAGVVLAATFAALGVIPILFLAQIAFIVAFGVLLDTFLVRSLLVPALAYDIGRTIWWPWTLAGDRSG